MCLRSKLHLHVGVCAAAALIAVGGAACGGGSDGSSDGNDEQQARAAVETLYAAIADGDADKVCDQLNDAARKQLEQGGLGSKGGSCAESFQKFLDQAEKAGGLDLTLKARVTGVEVTGDRAVAKVAFGKGVKGEVPLEKVDGEWKLEAAGATPTQ